MGLKAGNIVVIGHPELAGFDTSAPVPAPEPTPPPVVEVVKEEVVEEEKIETASPEETDPRIFNSTKKGSQYMEDLLGDGDFLLFDKFINKDNNS